MMTEYSMARSPPPLRAFLILLACLLGSQGGDAAVATTSASHDGSTCSSSSSTTSSSSSPSSSSSSGRPTCVTVEYINPAASQYEKEVLNLLREACHTADGAQLLELPSSQDLLVVNGAQRAKDSACGLSIVVSLEYSARSFLPLAKKEDEYRQLGVLGPVVFLRFLTPGLLPLPQEQLGLTSSFLVQAQLQQGDLQLLRDTPDHLSAISLLRRALTESQVFPPQGASSHGKTTEDGQSSSGNAWGQRMLWLAVPFGYAAGVVTGEQVKQGVQQGYRHARRWWGVEPKGSMGTGSAGPVGIVSCCCGQGCGQLVVPPGERQGAGRRGG